MDRNFYNNDFEEFLKQKADQHKMYPSDRVWNNIYSSLHGRKKWYGLGFIILFIGAGLITGKELVVHNYNKIAAQFNDGDKTPLPTVSTALTINSNQVNRPTGKKEAPVVSINALRNKPAEMAHRPLPLLENSRDVTNEPSITAGNPVTATDNTLIIENSPLTAVSKPEINSNVSDKPVVIARKQPASPESISNKNAPSVKEESTGPVTHNDNAAVTPVTVGASRWSYQLFGSPIVSYRRLSIVDQAAAGIPASAGNVNQYVHHKPAIGFEVGGHLQYQLSSSLSVYAGAQLNYSRYYIDAFKYHKEKASIALNNSSLRDTVSGYTNIRNFQGYAPEQLQNKYLQLSIPIGIQIKLIGTKRLSLNVAGGVQPTFMISNNTYLISSDYKNYIQSPDLARNFNVHTNFEAFISYKTGSIKWQLGPQFRSQLLSSYSNQYRVREYLTEYGIKLGVTKSF